MSLLPETESYSSALLAHKLSYNVKRFTHFATTVEHPMFLMASSLHCFCCLSFFQLDPLRIANHKDIRRTSSWWEGDARAHRSTGERIFGVSPMAVILVSRPITVQVDGLADPGATLTFLERIMGSGQVFPKRARFLRINWGFLLSSMIHRNRGRDSIPNALTWNASALAKAARPVAPIVSHICAKS